MENPSTVITLNKEEKQFNKSLTHHIDRYSSLRDWSELANWLTKLKAMVSQYKGVIVDYNLLLRKLATSLNASLPAALHQNTLDIYHILLKRFITNSQCLQVLCLGLFTYYNNANIKNKIKVVEMLRDHLPKFGKDIQMLLTGLFVAVLPSLSEMHEPLIKEINILFERLSEVVGHQLMIESTWIAILRSSGARIPGLKHISAKIGKVEHEEENDDEDDFWNQQLSYSQKAQGKEEEIQEPEKEVQMEKESSQRKGEVKDYCPHIETLVINALIACIEDPNILITKSALDFLYKYLPLKSDILSEESKIKLCYATIWLLNKRDMGVTRKINFWIFGKPDSDNRFQINPKNVEYILTPLISFLKTSETIQPLKIIFNLFNEHDQLPFLTMEVLAKQIVSYAIRQKSDPEVTKYFQRILDKIHNQLNVLSKSLGKSLLTALENNDYHEANGGLAQILFLLKKILRPNEIKQLVFDFLTTVMISYKKEAWQNSEYSVNALKLAIQIIETYTQILKESKSYSFKETFADHVSLYESLIKKIKQNQKNQFEEQLSYISKLLVRLYEIFDVYEIRWVDCLMDNLWLENPHFLIPVEVVGESLEKEGPIRKQLVKRSEIVKDNCLSMAVNKLWGLLSLGHLQSKVIPLLLRLSKHFPKFFIESLNHSFQSNPLLTITKFSLFWHQGPRYPTIINSQQLSEIFKEGFFRMLDYLDNGNPLVKYNSKIWINECFPDFNRILDPILQIILHPKDSWYQTFKGQYVFAKTPKLNQITSCINYLNSIIKHTENKFYKFATKPISYTLVKIYERFKGKQLLKQNEQNKNEDNSYIKIIFEIIIRLLGSKFVNDNNAGIDLVCCEMLENFIKGIDDSQLCVLHIQKNIKDILVILHFATANNDHILQIQLLNLIDTIFFQSTLRNTQQISKLRIIVSNEYFIKVILEGLNTRFPYIKERFVEFINKSIIFFLEYHNNCSELISTILNTYFTKIIEIKKEHQDEELNIEISNKQAEILILFMGIKELLSYFLNLHIRPFVKEKSQNEPDSGVFNLYTWNSYVNLKVERKQLEGRGRRSVEEISRQITNQFDQLLFTMIECWTLSPLISYYKISREGLSEYDRSTFLQFNTKLRDTIVKYEAEESVERYIINLARVLLNKYPRETMESIIKNWESEKQNIGLKMKILEILNMSSLPIEQFYHIVAEIFQSRSFAKKKRSYELYFYPSKEQSILHFCQFYTHYNLQTKQVFQPNNLLITWEAFFRFIRLFAETRTVLTVYALVQLIDLFMVKYPPTHGLIKEERLKKDISFVSSLLNELVSICSGKIKIVTAEQALALDSFLPFPTSIFEVYMLEQGKVQEAKVQYMYFNELNPQKICQYCRIYAFIIMKRVFYHFLHYFYSEGQATLAKKSRDIISPIFPVIEDKSQLSIYNQCASQLILTLFQTKTQKLFIKQFKTDILYIFNKDDFFICSSRTLHCWVKIMDMIIDENKDHDIFTEYLEKVSLASSIFSSYTIQTKKKIKSFERICFILFSGKRDKYIDKTHLLIDKIIEVIKNSEASQPVLILIFFCIRILILRTSSEKLTKLITNVWQLIMFLLMSIFKKNQESLKEKINLNLLWAALKLIELVSIMEINEFHSHQWIFFYDFVGIKFSTEKLQNQEINSQVKPLIGKYLPNNVYAQKGEVEQTSEIGHLIIKQDKIDDFQLLKTKALLLTSYLIRKNQCRMKFDMKEIEALIENDFLNLDEFIFKLK